MPPCQRRRGPAGVSWAAATHELPCLALAKPDLQALPAPRQQHPPSTPAHVPIPRTILVKHCECSVHLLQTLGRHVRQRGARLPHLGVTYRSGRHDQLQIRGRAMRRPPHHRNRRGGRNGANGCCSMQESRCRQASGNPGKGHEVTQGHHPGGARSATNRTGRLLNLAPRPIPTQLGSSGTITLQLELSSYCDSLGPIDYQGSPRRHPISTP